ncbi:MAG: UvrD-helicase domain-containing protein [Clostridia bacterium]|nr:UvrD-helicase domain-containing protein [Clostridia bacterium]
MPNFTPEQQKVIDYKGGDLLVSASAGSGKTTVMVARIIQLISSGASIKNMLVTTFTNAAAEDICKKLSDAILMARSSAAKKERERYSKELEYLPGAAICTLHSMCQKLVRKYFYITGDDPAFEIVEPVDEDVWEKESIREELDDWIEKGDLTFVRVYRKFLSKRKDSGLVSIIKDIFGFISTLPEPEKWLNNCCNLYGSNEAREEAEKALEKRKQAIKRSILDLEICLKALGAPKGKECIMDLEAFLNDPDYKMGTMTPARHGGLLDEIDKIRKKIKLFHGNCFEYDSDAESNAKETAEVLAEITLGAYKRLAKKKSDKGVLSFSDLEQKTLKILKSEAGDEIRNSLTHVFIDEYQDINPVQNEIIDLLGRGNQFFVGDLKQSIYAFRGCTPRAFSEKRRVFLGGSGCVIDLNRNFRSKPGILQLVNNVFSRVMTEEFGDVNYLRDASFDLAGADVNDNSVGVVRLIGTDSKEKKNTDEIYSVKDNYVLKKPKLSERAYAAEQIVCKLKSEGFKNDDIVFLVRSRTNVDELSNYLSECGYPVTIDCDKDISDNIEISNIINYVKVIDNYKNDISLIGAMRSPFGGFSDEELSRIREVFPDSKNVWFYEAVKNFGDRIKDIVDPKNIELASKINGFFEEIKRYGRLSKTLSVSELLGRITSEKKAFMTALVEENGEAKSASLGSLMAYSEKFSGTLSEFLENMENSPPKSKAVATVGSIRIMSIHSSKGLEFPAVILYDLERSFQTRGYDSRITVMPNARLGLCCASIEDGDGEKKPGALLYVAKAEKEKISLEEELRLLYVAMTRAKNKLILIIKEKGDAKNKEDAKSPSQWLRSSLDIFGDYLGEVTSSESLKKTNKIKFNQADKDWCDDFLAKEMPKAMDIKHSVTSMLASLVVDDDSSEVFASETAPEYDTKNALARGSAYHKALELYDYSRSFDEQILSLKEQVENSELIDDNKLKSAVLNIAGCAGDRAMHREQPFMLSAAGLKGIEDGLIIQGVIDLLLLGEKNEIIDYKTGGITDDRKAKYLKQLSLYSAAAERLLGIKIDETKIYLIDEERFME